MSNTPTAYIDPLPFVYSHLLEVMEFYQAPGETMQLPVYREMEPPRAKDEQGSVVNSYIVLRQVNNVSNLSSPNQFISTYQIICQAIDNDDCRILALDVLDRLKEQYDTTFNIQGGSLDDSLVVAVLKIQNGPIPLGNSGEGRFQYSINFTIQYGV